MGGRPRWNGCYIPRNLNRKAVRRIAGFMKKLEEEAEPFRAILAEPVFRFYFDDGRIVHKLSYGRYNTHIWMEKYVPEEIADLVSSSPGFWQTWEDTKHEIDKKLEHNCHIEQDAEGHFTLSCENVGAFTESDILKLFETLRTQMPVVEDLLREKSRKY
ncbi:hypothetical protein D6D85_14500 [Candidatus Methanodesulfokora washburnensis]|uniref:Uncharacterized protein n=2 Tax=Candidatus Methanodesulfokora washburnensis TaxID=2478471 RepID=A0A429GEN6_9CREN|nr:hypothetical protein D6D85_14500 [Candidatus Methanodesulfokores washburnensis]